jgi:hypothetical protein
MGEIDIVVKARNNLKRVLDEAVIDPEWKSKKNPDGSWTTYCNLSLYHIFENAGWQDLLPRTEAGSPYLANDLVAWFISHQVSWQSINGSQAHLKANEGLPTIACRDHPAHGHVAHVYPAEQMGFSPSLNKDVPWVANIGAVPKDLNSEADANSICKVSEAFAVSGGEPLYFTYVATIHPTQKEA